MGIKPLTTNNNLPLLPNSETTLNGLSINIKFKLNFNVFSIKSLLNIKKGRKMRPSLLFNLIIMKDIIKCLIHLLVSYHKIPGEPLS